MGDKKSVVVQVDETTKSIMQEIETSITSDLYDTLEDVKREVSDSSEEFIKVQKQITNLETKIKNIENTIIILQNKQLETDEKISLILDYVTPFWKKRKKGKK